MRLLIVPVLLVMGLVTALRLSASQALSASSPEVNSPASNGNIDLHSVSPTIAYKLLR